jgi:hypothetical protein
MASKTKSVALVRKQTIPTSDRRFPVKFVPNFVDRGCRVVNATDASQPLISVFTTGGTTFSFKLILSYPQEADWTPFIDPLLLRKMW